MHSLRPHTSCLGFKPFCYGKTGLAQDQGLSTFTLWMGPHLAQGRTWETVPSLQ